MICNGNERIVRCLKWGMIAFLIALTAGCGYVQPEPKTPPPAPLPEDKSPQEQPITAPLTGLPADAPVDERVVAVMIENHNQARPQSGLDKADWVFEVLAEGWITRFVAIYQSQKPERLGPVRSVRPYFIDIAEGMNAVLVHAGGSTEALARLKQTNYEHLDEIYNAGRYFWREKFRRMPHNLYTDMARLREAIADKGWETKAGALPQFHFLQDEEVRDGQPATRVEITYHRTYDLAYAYDSGRRQYMRETKGKPHRDMETEEQLAVTNLIVMEAPHRIVDKEGRREVILTGQGEGMLFQRGMATPIQWHRKQGEFFVFTDAAGEPIRLLPGNTWVNIIPDKPGMQASVNIVDGSENLTQ
jgi:hypothetical protein